MFHLSTHPLKYSETVNITNGMVNTLNSKILNDSELVQKSSGNLRKQLGYNQGWNDLDLSDKGSFMFNVSVNPGEKELDGTDYLSRITNLYTMDTLIFQETTSMEYLNQTLIF